LPIKAEQEEAYKIYTGYNYGNKVTCMAGANLGLGRLGSCLGR